MTFTVKTNDKNKLLSSIALQYKAYKFILMGKLAADELIINEFCIKHYKKPLKTLCLKIISNSKFYYSVDRQDIIIKIPDKKLNKLAELITFGNGQFIGSNILKLAYSV